MMRIGLILCICVVNLIGYAQNDSLQVKEVFLKSQDFYNRINTYQINMQYTLYKSATSNEKAENYHSNTIKKGANYYSKIHNTEFIEIGDKSLKINHDEQAVLLSKRVNKKASLGAVNNILAMLPQFKKYTVTKTEKQIICEFIAHDINQLPFTKVIVIFNKDYSIKSQTLYLSEQSVFKDNNGHKVASNPRLEITFLNFKTQNIAMANAFSLSKYISVSGNKIKLSNSLKAYQLINTIKN